MHIELPDIVIYKDQIVQLLDCYLDLLIDAYDNQKYLNCTPIVD